MAHRMSLLVLCAGLLSIFSYAAAQGEAVDPGMLVGKVQLPGNQLAANVLVKIYLADGSERRAFVNANGEFSFSNLPAGSHLLQAQHSQYFFPEVRVDMSSKSGLLRAIVVGQGKPLSLLLPLQLRPLGELQYFEKRKAVDVLSYLKSPYGIMICIALFVIVVMPRIKVDPEEMKEFQAQLKGGSTTGSSGSGAGQQRIASGR